MKKFLSAICLLTVLAVLLTGCKKSDDISLYDCSDFSKYITLAKYKDITVDSSSKEFKEYFDDIVRSDMDTAKLTEQRALTAEDKVENGDTVIIDFVGKMNGQTFSGGSATDTELTIGSGTMIPGFEEGIIGAVLNKTIAVNVTFPDPYPSNPDFNGKPAVFDITVKSGTRTSYPELSEDVAKKLGYETLDDYKKQVTEKAFQDYLCDLIVESSKVKKYPEKELEYFVDYTIDYYQQMCESYNMTFEEFLKNQNTTEEEFRKSITESSKPTIQIQLVFYNIAKNEDITITQAEKDTYIKGIADTNGTTVEKAKEQLNDADIEFYCIFGKVSNYLTTVNKLI